MNLIVACDTCGVIGDSSGLCWKIPEDMKYFKEKTLNTIVIMGRKTFETLPKPLEKRINIIITRKFHSMVHDMPDVYYSDVEHVFDLLKKLNPSSEKEVFVIGGAEIYSLFFPYVNKVYLTLCISKGTIGETKSTDTDFLDTEGLTMAYGEEPRGNVFMPIEILESIRDENTFRYLHHKETLFGEIKQSINPKYRYSFMAFERILPQKRLLDEDI